MQPQLQTKKRNVDMYKDKCEEYAVKSAMTQNQTLRYTLNTEKLLESDWYELSVFLSLATK